MKKNLIAIITFILFLFMIFSGCNENNAEDGVPGGSIIFDYPPVDLDENLGHIKPMGLIGGGGHVTPTDHVYFITPDWVSEGIITCDIYSPANGVVTSIQRMTSQLGGATELEYDYRIVIKHSKTISSIYIHMDELSDKILNEAPTTLSEKSVNINVKAGELVGRWRGQLDYSVVDQDVTLSGFVDPSRYSMEDFKIHCADPFNYFNGTIKNKMIQKHLRTTEPIGGKIDYDIDGRLIGTWFREIPVSDELWEYNCLSIVYDYLDPDFIVVSFGDYYGEPKWFGVVDNSPDPADISVDSGIVSYELVEYWYVDENGFWWDEESLLFDPIAQLKETVEGAMLVELVDDRTLKVETFPGLDSDEVDGFTDDVVIYER